VPSAGILNVRSRFPKFFGQIELRTYIESVLDAEAIPAEIGVFTVFKDEATGQAFLAGRQRRKAAAPRKRLSEVRFEENRELLEPFLSTIAALGRLPEADECAQVTELAARFGSLQRAFALVKRVTGADEWDAIARRSTEDLLVYLALGRFRRRPPMSALPVGLPRDIRAFFGSDNPGDLRSRPRRGRETRAEQGLADERLFQAGDVEAIDDACRRSDVGKLLPNALYLHRSALEALDPLLRVYEGCFQFSVFSFQFPVNPRVFAEH
jgi:DNA phosphorothioation-associated putative methyltransferase